MLFPYQLVPIPDGQGRCVTDRGSHVARRVLLRKFTMLHASPGKWRGLDRKVWWVVALMHVLFAPLQAQDQAVRSAREVVAEASALIDVDQQKALVETLAAANPEEVAIWFAKWKEGEIHLLEDDAGNVSAVTLEGEPDAEDKYSLASVVTGKTVAGPDGAVVRKTKDELTMADTDSSLRKAMKGVTDRMALSSADPVRRLRAVKDTGLEQDPNKLVLLEQRVAVENTGKVKAALVEAMALIKLRSEDLAVREAAVIELGKMGSIASQEAIKTVRSEAETAGQTKLAGVCSKALSDIAGHISRVNTASTAFHGLSYGSVLLIAAIGLAITFGLMGVINMAHGELIVVGAYTTYVIQKIFATGLVLSPFGMKISIPGLNLTGTSWGMYFIVAIPASFLVAAGVGLLLERSIIRFLYKRPLESLLATWGVSMVLQQLFKLVFGSNNVQVESPAYLSGNWTVNDVAFNWNRVFVIAFAAFIIFLTWVILTKTRLGLLIRAVMQNRSMAACMGV